MITNKEFEIYCQFSAICKKNISASSFEAAKIIAESEKKIQFNEIVQFLTPCKIDEALSHEIDKQNSEEHSDYEFKNWGSE